MYDHEKQCEAWKAMVLDYDFDMAPALGTVPAQPLDTLGLHLYKWPGAELANNLPSQFVEGEYVLADEYDQLLSNPGDFTLRVLLPRMARAFEPLTSLLPLHWFGSLPLDIAPIVAMPRMTELLTTLLHLGEQWREYAEIHARYGVELEGLGYPVVYASYCHAPFDIIADYLRGLRGVMLDMYRQPDKLLAAIDLFTQIQIDSMIAAVEQTKNPRIPIYLHRGAAGFMSNEHYERFYWPSLKAVIRGLLDAGLLPMLYCQGDYTPRLHFLTELPKGQVPLHFDVVDREKAREAIGGIQCFWGNVPASLLCTGSVEQIIDDVRELIDLFGDTGGLIIDGAVEIPDEAKPENVEAMVEAVVKYGML